MPVVQIIMERLDIPQAYEQYQNQGNSARIGARVRDVFSGLELDSAHRNFITPFTPKTIACAKPDICQHLFILVSTHSSILKNVFQNLASERMDSVCYAFYNKTQLRQAMCDVVA